MIKHRVVIDYAIKGNSANMKSLTVRVRQFFAWIIIILLVPISSAQSSDEQDWWFNVELVAFSRVVEPSNNEDFSRSKANIDVSQANPLLFLAALQQRLSYQASLPYCEISKQPFPDIDLTFILDDTLFYSAEMSRQRSGISQRSGIESNPTESLDRETNNDEEILRQNVAQSQIESDENKATLDLQTLQTLLLELADSENDYAQQQARIIAMESELEKISEFFVKLNSSQRVDCEPNKTKIKAKSATGSFDAHAINQIPQNIFAKEAYFAGDTQLITKAEVALSDYATSVFRQRDIKPLLHTAWRLNVAFGAENAQFFRVRAGKLLEVVNSEDYEKWNKRYNENRTQLPDTGEDDLFSRLQSSIEANEPVDWLALEADKTSQSDNQALAEKQYELDGIIKVYLDYVNQVPYLHIESEFNHYKLAVDTDGLSYLEAFTSAQRRRIISKQIHYFDHPAFGIIVRLERYTPPDPSELLVN